MSAPEHPPIQLGMLGVSGYVDEHHLVQAHTRLLLGGGEVFVPEHLRKNRGKRAGPPLDPRPRHSEPPSRQQPSLFAKAKPTEVAPVATVAEAADGDQLPLL